MKALKSARQQAARERVSALFEQASKRPAYAKRYVELARKISSKYKIKIPDTWRRRFCKKCNAFLVPGRNARMRVRKKSVVITCGECSAVRRVAAKR